MDNSITDLHTLESDIIRLTEGLKAFHHIINHYTIKYDQLLQKYNDLTVEHLKLLNSLNDRQTEHDKIVDLLIQNIQRYEQSNRTTETDSQMG